MYKITAIIPAYNAELFIEAALSSVFEQTYSVDEIIVVNDCSQDDTSKVVNELSSLHENIHVYSLGKNKGVSYARNFGLAKARNNWILFLDADDVLEPNIVEKANAYLENSDDLSKLAMIHTSYKQIDIEGNIFDGIIKGKELKQGEAFGELLVRNQIITPSGLLLNKEFVLKYGNFNEKLSSKNEDWDLWLRLSQFGDIGYIDEPLVRVRRHNSNATRVLNVVVAGSPEQTILDQYNLDVIRAAILCRSYSKVKNILDYVSMLYRFQKWREGVIELEQLVSEDVKEKSSILFLKAVYFLHNEQFEASKSLFEQILKITPQHGASLNNLAVLNAMNSNFLQAKHLLESALDLNPNYMDAIINMRLLHTDGEFRNSYRFTLRELRPVLLSYEG
ncbi:glycosyltransferase family A protein [Paenibacillus oryzisoli]|uniref:Glycosyltransferase 2-like domain-containing protein n=1 Tax=Paenibacillus oryzisoli TaxID=1850517 RepID=A0A198A0G1_9BACL|nr:glycosyltransferase family A protein [Paenibacillus oryzisoli]OAS14508.1 hypothetical protein A8708_33965 [Paenibacillus oryzisoli]